MMRIFIAIFMICTLLSIVQGKEVKGMWVFGESVRLRGASSITSTLSQHGITDVFLLVKGENGKVGYTSRFAPSVDSSRDTLREMIPACHAKGIRVHAWLSIEADAFWASHHPEDAMYHVGNPAMWNKGPYLKSNVNELRYICPLSTTYRSYMENIIREILDNYNVDGIHLDYIRYPHIVYCFCPRHQKKAKELGIDLRKVRSAVYRVLYGKDSASYARDSENYCADTESYLKDTTVIANRYVRAYNRKDTDLISWVNQRNNEITSFVQDVYSQISDRKPSVKLSISLMPEAGKDNNELALCYYAQDYQTLCPYLDFIVPMVFNRTYGENQDWASNIVKNVARSTNKTVYAGIQLYGKRGSYSKNDFENAIKTFSIITSRNVKGYVIFQYGAMSEPMWNILDTAD